MNAELEEIRNNFLLFDNQLDKFEYLIELGKNNKGIPEDLKNDDDLIIGCASKSWLIFSIKEDNVSIKVDSEAHIVRGLLTILQKSINQLNPNKILELNAISILEWIGLENNITSQRMNGFMSALNTLKEKINSNEQY
ncbi:SufE family protein [Candidatus Marinimicrobia bacterium]|mgnify:FL=1|jgi:cysteine desulfuration protein SufE|nr:SufE family protein [Candidatus Neomarinimicrobiota bacterium]